MQSWYGHFLTCCLSYAVLDMPLTVSHKHTQHSTGVQEVQLLQAKVDELRANLLSAQSQLEQSANVSHELGTVKAQIENAGLDIHSLPSVSITSATASPAHRSGTPGSANAQTATPASGQASPSQISPFQSMALELPVSTTTQTSKDMEAADVSAPAADITSELLAADESTLNQDDLVTKLQKENAALKGQMAQLSQREAAEEADVSDLQTQNKELIAELEKLRGQIGEVGQHLLSAVSVSHVDNCIRNIMSTRLAIDIQGT